MAYVPPILLGFLATAFQIFLMREFSVHFYGNELTFGFVLASWLFWGGLGSLLASRLKPSDRILDRLYYAVILLFPISLVILRFSRFALGVLPGELTGMGPALLFSLGICLLSSLPLGGLFVLNARTLGGDVPSVYLFESLGAALAGLVVDFGPGPVRFQLGRHLAHRRGRGRRRLPHLRTEKTARLVSGRPGRAGRIRLFRSSLSENLVEAFRAHPEPGYSLREAAA